MEQKICAVVAIGRNRELGKEGKLLWHIPDDLKRFKQLTLGHPIIMGRKTFESIVGYLGGPLPGRTNIVVTRQPEKLIADNPYMLIRANEHIRSENNASMDEKVIVVDSLDSAIEKAKALDAKEIHIGGGAEIYRQALPYITKLYLTRIDAEAPDADAFFPPYESEFTKITFDEEHEWNGIKYRWVDLERP